MPSRRPLAVRLLVASRPLSWVNTAYPFAAAYMLGGGGVDAALLVGAAFFLVPYNLAMYGINDVFDHASDILNPRKGGVEGALLDPSEHRSVLLLGPCCRAPRSSSPSSCSARPPRRRCSPSRCSPSSPTPLPGCGSRRSRSSTRSPPARTS